MNWATTIDLKPVALSPSACIPFIPKTERRDILKIYGEAPDTVSVSIVTVAPEELGLAFKSVGTKGKRYVKTLSLITV